MVLRINPTGAHCREDAAVVSTAPGNCPSAFSLGHDAELDTDAASRRKLTQLDTLKGGIAQSGFGINVWRFAPNRKVSSNY